MGRKIDFRHGKHSRFGASAVETLVVLIIVSGMTLAFASYFGLTTNQFFSSVSGHELAAVVEKKTETVQTASTFNAGTIYWWEYTLALALGSSVLIYFIRSNISLKQISA